MAVLQLLQDRLCGAVDAACGIEIFDADQPRVRAIVDWELSTLGHPLSDLGYFCMALRLPRNPVIPGLKGIDRAAEGLPSERQIVERYVALSGRDAFSDWPFILAFNFFRLAAIAQGVAKRAVQGNASSAQADTTGRMVPVIAALMTWGDRWAAPTGRPIELVHECGQVATATVVCDHCGGPLTLHNVRATAGPAWHRD